MKIRKYGNIYIVELEEGDQKAGKNFYAVMLSFIAILLVKFVGDTLVSPPPGTAEDIAALYSSFQRLFSITQVVTIVYFLWQLATYILTDNYASRGDLEIKDIVKAIERGGDFIYFKNDEAKIVKFEKEKVKHFTVLDDGRFIIETEPPIDTPYA